MRLIIAKLFGQTSAVRITSAMEFGPLRSGCVVRGRDDSGNTYRGERPLVPK